MGLDNLQDLFIEELRDVYSAEKQITKALPRMAKAASSPELRNAFEQHLKVTEQQIARLEQIFGELEMSPRGKKCKGMEGLLAEGKEMMAEDGEEAVIDAALIAAAQRVEHYEIAAYGCIRNYANLLGLETAAKLLQETLDEEEETDALLTELAEGGINTAALAVGSDDEDEGEE
ncbi:MAG: ferritin-like domain-containing protein [Gemmatimonadales bacterium]|nr:ferritin-like domain-containing protein [Gemmatimonadales bacterium]